MSSGIDLTTESKVVCTLQSTPGIRVLRYVAIDAVADTYRVIVSGPALVPISVACFVIS
jgi:hypothetical protein